MIRWIKEWEYRFLRGLYRAIHEEDIERARQLRKEKEAEDAKSS